MKREYFFIPGLTAEKRIHEDALEKTLEGDECLVHYHSSGLTCNEKCHIVELPTEE